MWATLAGRPRPLRAHLPHVVPGYAPVTLPPTLPPRAGAAMKDLLWLLLALLAVLAVLAIAVAHHRPHLVGRLDPTRPTQPFTLAPRT